MLAAPLVALSPLAVMAQAEGELPAPSPDVMLGTPLATVRAENTEPTTAPLQFPILTLDQDRLFRQSAWGSAAIHRAEQAAQALNAENREIEASLESEERELTERRNGLAPEAFAKLAEAFNLKAEEYRHSQDAKSREISRALDEDRKRFFELAGPVLVELLSRHGAVAIVANEALILALSSADVTEEAVTLLDLRLPAPLPEGDAAAQPSDGGAAPEEGSGKD